MAREPIEGEGDLSGLKLAHGTQEITPMSINYNKTVSEVYQNVAKHFINRDQNLDVLCILSTHRDHRSSDLPSWTPDWRVSTSTIRMIECWDYVSMKCFASGFTRSEPQLQDDSGLLLAQGYATDRIISLLDVTTKSPGILESGGADFNSLSPHAKEHFKPYDLNKGLRRCCETETGQTCLVPAKARPGDLIFILLGARPPFVLRPVESPLEQNAMRRRGPQEQNICLERHSLEVVGPCCVADLM
jgi:hypothetical protein